MHVSGIARCASVAACPVCAPAVGEGRAREVDAGLSYALGAGYLVYFVTATVSHHLGDDLAAVQELVNKSWTATFAGERAQRWKQRTGFAGAIRAREVTYGANGWHPHVHAALVFRPGSSTNIGDIRALGTIFGQAVGRRGGVAVVAGARSPGWKVDLVTTTEGISHYLTKVEGLGVGWSAGLELARGDMKTAKRAGLKPFDLLTMAADGDRRAEARWREYETATMGRRMLVWSRGLKAELGLVEISDEALVEVAPDDELVVELFVPARVWRTYRREGRLADLWDRLDVELCEMVRARGPD